MQEKVTFYNESVRKILYPPEDGTMDLASVPETSRFISGKQYIAGKEYAVKYDYSNPSVIKAVYELKSMLFEIRKVRDSAPFENIRTCSVRVIEYEEGREYPKVENVVVSGYFYNAYPEAIYDSKGFWCTGKDGREVFCVTERMQCVSSSENSIKKYLSSVLVGSGIGKAVVEKLFVQYGLDMLEKIKCNDPDLALIVKNQKKRDKLIALVEKSEDNEKSLNFLLHNNIGAEQAISIIKSLGSSAFYQLTNNPYVLLKHSNVPLDTIYKIATANGIPFKHKANLEGLILRYIDYRIEAFGDIYIQEQDLFVKTGDYTPFELFYDRFNRYNKFTGDEIETALKELCDHDRIVIRKDIGNSLVRCIYDKYMYSKEDTIVRKLLQLHGSRDQNENFVPEAEVRRIIREMQQASFGLDSRQEDAVVQALTNKISVVSGGPGTGKTCVTKTIVDVFRYVFPNKKIQLCAPTGKASRRMSEVIGLPACTLHKKLGYGSETDATIEEELLIIDECSMIDVDLFHKTLVSVSDSTTIVLVGDYNQLPSVGPGLILRDIIDSNALPCTILENVHRQAGNSEIINAANAILRKDHESLNQDYGKDFVFIEQKTVDEAYHNIAGSIQYLIHHGIDPDKIQILTPQNEGIVGTSGLNNLMRDLCNPLEMRGRGKNAGGIMFYVGDRIIETENNPDLGIFNGSIGRIIGMTADGFLAEFDDRTVELMDSDMKTIKLGYAITVHKSQGSEFDYVFAVALKDHEYTLNKNLLYTAVTRAKKMFVLFGQKDVVRSTIDKEIVWDRRSQIKLRLIDSIDMG